MESIILDKNKGKHECGTEYSEYDPIVTNPFSNDSLNLVSYKPCFSSLL